MAFPPYFKVPNHHPKVTEVKETAEARWCYAQFVEMHKQRKQGEALAKAKAGMPGKRISGAFIPGTWGSGGSDQKVAPGRGNSSADFGSWRK